jgi:hypothetical protein
MGSERLHFLRKEGPIFFDLYIVVLPGRGLLFPRDSLGWSECLLSRQSRMLSG